MARHRDVGGKDDDLGGAVLLSRPDAPGFINKKILKAGEPGTAPPDGAQVIVHYTGKLTNGKVFDSSVTRGEPFEFRVGEGQVIRGWDVGVASMNKGEKAILSCSPEYAYGNRAMGNVIPANSTLDFEVELLDWRVPTPGAIDARMIGMILTVVVVIVMLFRQVYFH